MNFVKILLVTLSLSAGIAQAKDTVTFFYDNQIDLGTVIQEFKNSRVAGDFLFTSHNVSEKDNATEQINNILSKAISTKYNTQSKSFKPEEAYQKEFSILMNDSSKWGAIVKRLEVGASSLGKMIELKVEKVPAYVFNETEIVYGEVSFERAHRIYTQWKAKQ